MRTFSKHNVMYNLANILSLRSWHEVDDVALQLSVFAIGTYCKPKHKKDFIWNVINNVDDHELKTLLRLKFITQNGWYQDYDIQRHLDLIQKRGDRLNFKVDVYMKFVEDKKLEWGRKS